jgi:FkbM family methyltransferase
LRSARALRAAIGKRRARAAGRREAQRLAGFVEHASRITPHVAVERDGSLFLLPTRQKDGTSRFAKREWKESRHLQRALHALEVVGIEVGRATFVDVGAHIGTTTITAVRRFGFRSALAFEPEVNNFRLLRANLGINGLEARIQTFNVAVSDHVGSAELELRPAIGSKHRLVGDDEAGRDTVRVPLTTLDLLVADGRLDPAEASLLWLDVEGHELEVLRGGRRLLERSVPIVMEFVPRTLQPDGITSLQTMLEPDYTHVVDLRHRINGRSGILRLDALAQLADAYEQSFTDLLVLRCPPVLARTA